MEATRFLRVFFTLVLLALAGVPLFNLVVDPYGLVGWVDIKGFNHDKPTVLRRLRMVKAHAVKKHLPDKLILGMSRAEVGLRPDHPAFGGGDVYNLGLASGTMYEVLRYFQHAHALRPQKQVVVALEFAMFNALKGPSGDFSENRLAVSLAEKAQARDFSEEMTLLLSWDALSDSLKTLAPYRPGLPRYTPLGHVEHNDMADWLAIHGGHRKRIRDEETRLFQRYLPVDGKPSFCLFPPGGNPEKNPFRHLQTLLKMTQRDGMDLRLFISPLHARYLEVLREAGLWPQLEQWKRKLVALIKKETNGQVPLLDFSGYHTFATEVVPPAGDEITQMRWFLEVSHFTPALGDEVLNLVLGPENQFFDPRFKRTLTIKNLENQLTAINREGAAYRKKFPKDLAEIKAAKEAILPGNFSPPPCN